jgi:hypothetical protein
MTSQTPPPSLSLEHLFSFRGKVTEVVDFGASGTGQRLDIHFEGPVEGARVRGRVRGIDHGHIRPDGVMEIDVRAVLVTHDGVNLSLSVRGILQGEKIRDITVKIFSGDPRYNWLDEKIIVGQGKSTPDGALRIDYFIEPGQ